MALYIPHRRPKCFESVTLVQPQHKGGAFKGPARGHCLNCMDEQEYDLTVPINRRDLINVIEAVTPKARKLRNRGRSTGSNISQRFNRATNSVPLFTPNFLKILFK